MIKVIEDILDGPSQIHAGETSAEMMHKPRSAQKLLDQGAPEAFASSRRSADQIISEQPFHLLLTQSDVSSYISCRLFEGSGSMGKRT
jgi:hypothetical protein